MVRSCTFALGILLLGSLEPLTAAVPPALEDAPLRAVQFVDANEGWAVGDHGVVWHSIDGGKTWERQRTGSHASLRSVQFLTPYIGWVVGRVDSPHGQGTQGVVLGTTDGGGTWQELSAGTLPGLNSVRFFDERRGIAVGDGTNLAPSGMFATTDGGQSWKLVPGPRAATWTASAFPTPSAGVVGGAWGRLMRVREGKFLPSEVDPLAGRAVRGMVMDDTRAVAVADGGRVLLSSDGGAKWGFANLPISPVAAESCDFRCAAKVGRNIWVAGRPGSIILHSPDDGQSWNLQTTGSPVPTNSLFMLDEKRGWAVGSLGTIRSTEDGGKTWITQKCGGQRAALLFAHADAPSLPLAAMAEAAGTEGYLAVGVAIGSTDPESAKFEQARNEFRFATAVRMVGGADAESAWGFPNPTHTREANTTNPAGTWTNADRLVRRMVLDLRTWRPDVVTTDAHPTTDPARQAVLTAMQEAFKKASDPAAFPEQLSELGLTVHAPKKLYALGTDDASATVRMDLTRFRDPIYNSARDAAEPAIALLPGSTNPDRQTFRLLSHRMQGAERHTGLFDDIELAEGGAARRVKPRANPELALLLTERAKAAQTRLQLETLARAPEAGAGAEKMLAHIAGTVAKMPDDMAVRASIAIAKSLAAEGKWTAARELFSLVATRYPAHPDAAIAMRWLTNYYASSEALRRIELGHQAVFQKAAFIPASSDGVKPASYVEPAITARQMFQFSSPDAAKQWNQSCLDLEPQIAAFGPAVSGDPAIQLSLQAARRKLGLYGDATQTITGLVRASGGFADYKPGVDPWRDCLAAELWLGNPASIPERPKPLGRVGLVSVKPLLDGKLDDPCWKTAQPIRLTDRVAESTSRYPTQALLAFDEKFLYVGVTCGHPNGEQVPKATTRVYDDDLSGHDRIEVMLDLDRDYQTYFRFCIDHRGCVADDCWGDRTWNPRWFVAVNPSETGWTAEVAIPLAELTSGALAHNQVWAGNVVRVLPGRGVQSWSGPTDATPRPEAMGLIQFLRE